MVGGELLAVNWESGRFYLESFMLPILTLWMVRRYSSLERAGNKPVSHVLLDSAIGH